MKRYGVVDPAGAQLWSLVALRWLIGWHFLYEGLAKVFNAYWTSAGYLASATGPLEGFFVWLASHGGRLQAVDLFNKAALIAIGIALLAGVGARLATWAGVALLAMYYLAHPPWIGADSAIPQEGSYLIVNKTLVELGAMLVLLAFPTSHVVGLARWARGGQER
jgi:thiosulfate dehydrogenase [quinone] large subunit